MIECPSYDWMTCPYAKCDDDGTIYCMLSHPERDCDDFFEEDS